MNINLIRIKNVYKKRGLLHTINFIIYCYVFHATKNNNIFNMWR